MKIQVWILIAVFVLLLLSVSSSIYSWLNPQVVTKTEFTRVPEIREVVKIRKLKVPVKEVVTVEKKEAVGKLALPAWLKEDENKQVLATGSIEPYEGKTNVVSVLDTETGDSSVLARQEPLPFIAFESVKEIGIRAGITTEGYGGDIYGRWSFARIGNIHAAFYAEGNIRGGNRETGNSPITGKAMLDLRYQWR
jgi:hypothetical protein